LATTKLLSIVDPSALSNTDVFEELIANYEPDLSGDPKVVRSIDLFGDLRARAVSL
jgi:hypothetical protein